MKEDIKAYLASFPSQRTCWVHQSSAGAESAMYSRPKPNGEQRGYVLLALVRHVFRCLGKSSAATGKERPVDISPITTEYDVAYVSIERSVNISPITTEYVVAYVSIERPVNISPITTEYVVAYVSRRKKKKKKNFN